MLTKAEIEWLHKVPETQRESASNGYLMSLVAVGIGAPLPIINMIATVIFFFQSRKEGVFVRFHVMQALISQFIINGIHFSWLISIIFGGKEHEFNANYLGFLTAVVIFNLMEFITNVIGAVKARKGELTSFFFVGPISKLIYYNELKKLYNEPPQSA